MQVTLDLFMRLWESETGCELSFRHCEVGTLFRRLPGQTAQTTRRQGRDPPVLTPKNDDVRACRPNASLTS